MKNLVYLFILSVAVWSCSGAKTEEKENIENAAKETPSSKLVSTSNENSTELEKTEKNSNEELKDNNSDATKTPKYADGEGPEMTFKEMTYDFGNINQGDKVAHTFVFTNTGKAPLIISKAVGSCGCTVPKYPENTPIAPGASEKIHVEFNSAGKSGKQNKRVTLTTNTESGDVVLNITANVAAPSENSGPYKK